MAKCKSCGAEIYWQETKAGKNMPCDPALVPFWAKFKAKDKVVTPEGDVVSCLLEGDPEEMTGVGRIPHWATCPNAAQHKRRK